MIKSFFISSKIETSLNDKARRHCRMLASRYGLEVKELNIGNLLVVLITDDPGVIRVNEVGVELCLGQVADHSTDWDRFLKIKIDTGGIIIENDYAGSIPVFYSQKDGFVLSTLEPCVYLATGTTLDDLSYENLYGFLRYSHFIWDETAWKHIDQITPDSRYKFSLTGDLVATDYLQTIKATNTRKSLSDNRIADELYQLNYTLVNRSLGDAREIVLPLSSGYDSRMIFSVLANDKKLASKTKCFTYGSNGSIEVEGGRRLSQLKDIEWHHVDLPCDFLDQHYLEEVSDLFGASLHMHGMYQVEFYEQIKKWHNISPSACITSGFMTGVPAGQHNGLLQITGNNDRLTDVMNRFSQSRVWSDADLEKIPVFSGKGYLEKAEERFRMAFNRFDGEDYQKSVMFDVWTRQRNFISYYPSLFQWFGPVASPHMCADYAYFFMSLNKDHLWNRKAVELMFLKHYPDMAKVASNSNGIVSLGNKFETFLFICSRIFARLGLFNPLPSKYQNAPIEFDPRAVRNSKKAAFYPLFGGVTEVKKLLEDLGNNESLLEMYAEALSGNVDAYSRILTIQSVALNLIRNNPINLGE